MNFLERQLELKLDIMESLSRSQRAVAVMLEGLADTTAQRGDSSELIGRELIAIARYQQVLGHRMLGIPLHRVRRGHSMPPWVASKYGLYSPFRKKKFCLVRGNSAIRLLQDSPLSG